MDKHVILGTSETLISSFYLYSFTNVFFILILPKPIRAHCLGNLSSIDIC